MYNNDRDMIMQLGAIIFVYRFGMLKYSIRAYMHHDPQYSIITSGTHTTVLQVVWASEVWCGWDVIMDITLQ